MFFHRMVEVLIKDVKMGVQYDPKKLENLVPLEFSEMVKTSILATNMDDMISELRSELDDQIKEDSR
jgi:hypothetical protein